MSELERLQVWYASQCNGDWEHSYGVKIDTLDNPGWTVTIDLSETELSSKAFAPINHGDSDEADWAHCRVESGQFIAAGGASNLTELLRTFLDWSET